MVDKKLFSHGFWNISPKVFNIFEYCFLCWKDDKYIYQLYEFYVYILNRRYLKNLTNPGKWSTIKLLSHGFQVIS
jgi:hypothetical protein